MAITGKRAIPSAVKVSRSTMRSTTMTQLRRWHPVNQMLSLRDAMDRLFEDSFVRNSQAAGDDGDRLLPINLRENANEYVIEAALPGFKPEDIDISVTGNEVTIRGETKQEESRDEDR
jgi:HSP20 family protein